MNILTNQERSQGTGNLPACLLVISQGEGLDYCDQAWWTQAESTNIT